MKDLYQIIIIFVFVILISSTAGYMFSIQRQISSEMTYNLGKIPESIVKTFKDGSSIEIKCLTSDMPFIPICRSGLAGSFQVAFKGCYLVCNLNYSGIRNITDFEGEELWVYKFQTEGETRVLNLSKGNEQMFFYLNQSGEYTVVLGHSSFTLQLRGEGWFTTMFNFYSYDNIEEYSTKLTSLRENDFSFIFNVFLFAAGIVIGIVMDTLFKKETIKIDTENYAIRIQPKKPKGKRKKEPSQS